MNGKKATNIIKSNSKSLLTTNQNLNQNVNTNLNHRTNQNQNLITAPNKVKPIFSKLNFGKTPRATKTSLPSSTNLNSISPHPTFLKRIKTSAGEKINSTTNNLINFSNLSNLTMLMKSTKTTEPSTKRNTTNRNNHVNVVNVNLNVNLNEMTWNKSSLNLLKKNINNVYNNTNNDVINNINDVNDDFSKINLNYLANLNTPSIISSKPKSKSKKKQKSKPKSKSKSKLSPQSNSCSQHRTKSSPRGNSKSTHKINSETNSENITTSKNSDLLSYLNNKKDLLLKRLSFNKKFKFNISKNNETKPDSKSKSNSNSKYTGTLRNKSKSIASSSLASNPSPFLSTTTNTTNIINFKSIDKENKKSVSERFFDEIKIKAEKNNEKSSTRNGLLNNFLPVDKDSKYAKYTKEYLNTKISEESLFNLSSKKCNFFLIF